MPLHGASQLHNNISGYRIAWIAGRVGSYKSSLSLMLAKPFLEQGYRLVTNMPCVWADNPNDIDFIDDWGHLKVIVIIDEGGTELQFGRQVTDIMRYPRKMDVILLIPSYIPPANQAKVLTIQGLFNTVSAGLPLVMYKWRVRIMDFRDGGTAVWSVPHELFGIYSSQSPGYDPAFIVEWLSWKTEQFIEKYSGKAPDWLSQVRQGADNRRAEKRISKMVDETSYGAQAITEAAESFSEASYDVTTLLNRSSKRRGF